MNKRNPLRGWQVDRAAIRHVGHELQRPECVLAERDGTVWAADARGGAMRIAPDGNQRLVVPPQSEFLSSADFDARYVQSQGSLPNGMTFLANGDLLIANWGTDAVEVMTREGRLRRLFDRIDGQPLGKANFPLRDSRGRLYLTVTTRMRPWMDSINARAADGYIALFDEQGNARIVADRFEGTNEIRMDANEEWLYVVESNGRRISRLRVQADGSLGRREVYGPSQLDGFPDGFAFDAFGNLWVTLIMADKLVAITPDGEVLTLLDDGDPEATKCLNAHFEARTLTPEIAAAAGGTLAPWLASLTFGGPDLHTVYLGSLRGTTLPSFRSPVAGLPLIHWNERHAA
ncbi:MULTISPECIES: SMP-30/gluconolactonase/LRE family protein [Ramlibacter]|uniref:SMP-30/gluconolactonase/LRE family protein n=1 Tax=Ramlibacter pinisoli TaxID=2682844 RepID=A0A6N8ILW9_9BURK|nr:MULTISPECIES: SMP-30/gluconolactonase/LRE family protein [Ramlibacter]MBA2960485.1 SMP-30/gluconolactonase/LRE family protein [Ramlibacter sp. CGMCC 1.13660]MVQ27817.1 SMP-30/gluconolactonase/LRE family protein [Ramlibacter pinisoli]